MTLSKEILTKKVVKNSLLKNHGGLRNLTFGKEILTKKIVKKICLKIHGGLRN